MIPNPQQYHMTRLRRVPSAAHSPSDLRVRLGAGTPNARLLHRHVLTRRQRDDLNHNVFTSSARPPGVCGGSAPASRSFVLAALRALHLDPGPRPHRPKPGRGRGQTTEKQQKRQRTPTFTGVPITDKETMTTSTLTKWSDGRDCGAGCPPCSASFRCGDGCRIKRGCRRKSCPGACNRSRFQ
jgi:hypothetical protein